MLPSKDNYGDIMAKNYVKFGGDLEKFIDIVYVLGGDEREIFIDPEGVDGKGEDLYIGMNLGKNNKRVIEIYKEKTSEEKIKMAQKLGEVLGIETKVSKELM